MSVDEQNALQTPTIQSNNIANINSTPSTVTLWMVQFYNIFIWICQFSWPIIATVKLSTPSLTTYCLDTYFDYNSISCSYLTLQDCKNDIKCTLFHSIVGYSDFQCRTDSDCSDCKCVASHTLNNTVIASWVFITLGLIFEVIRLIFILSFINKKNEFKLVKGSCSDCIFLSCTDSIMIRLIQINKSIFWKKYVMDRYNKGELFGCDHFMCITPDILLHHIPVYVCGAIIYSAGLDLIILNITFFVGIILFIVSIIHKYHSRITHQNQHQSELSEQPEQQAMIVKLPDGRLATVQKQQDDEIPTVIPVENKPHPVRHQVEGEHDDV